jgi:hypothetical protein
MKYYLRLIMLFVCFGFAGLTASAQEASRSPVSSRQESETAIRAAVYESALAAATGNLQLYRKHVARRTLELNRLVFEGLREIPDGKEMLAENKFDTADKFFDAMFVQGASQYAKFSREELEQRARTQASGSLTFLNEGEAVLQVGSSSLRLVYEDKEWKVDETESSKELFLKTFPFTEQTRAKIQKL